MADDRPTVNLSSDRPDGTISLYDGYRPSLSTGEYRFVIQQTITLNGHGTFSPAQFEFATGNGSADSWSRVGNRWQR